MDSVRFGGIHQDSVKIQQDSGIQYTSSVLQEKIQT